MHSPINRRVFLGALSAPVLLGIMPARAYDECSPYKGENVDGLLHGFGFRIGPQDRKFDMVSLVAPWCPICESLLKDARNGELPYNLFAVPVEPYNATDRIRVAEICFAQTDQEKNLFHSRSMMPNRTLTVDEVRFVNRVQKQTLLIAYSYAARFQSQTPNGVPTNYHATSEGFFAWSGYLRSDLIELAKGATPTSLKSGFFTRDQLGQAMKRLPNHKTYRFRDADTRLRLLPADDAVAIICSDPPYAFDADYEVRVDGERWVVMDWRDGTQVFIERAHLDRV